MYKNLVTFFWFLILWLVDFCFGETGLQLIESNILLFCMSKKPLKIARELLNGNFLHHKLQFSTINIKFN